MSISSTSKIIIRSPAKITTIVVLSLTCCQKVSLSPAKAAKCCKANAALVCVVSRPSTTVALRGCGSGSFPTEFRSRRLLMLMTLVLILLISPAESTVSASFPAGVVCFPVFKFVSCVLPLLLHLHFRKNFSNSWCWTSNRDIVDILPPSLGRVRHQHSCLDFV